MLLVVLLKITQECLGIFGLGNGPGGSSEPSTNLKIYYSGYGTPLTLMYVNVYVYAQPSCLDIYVYVCNSL